MLPGTDPADPVDDPADLFHGTADHEFFKSPEGQDMKSCIFHIAAVIELDGDARVTLNAGDRGYI
jgi:hypothetical protein